MTPPLTTVRGLVLRVRVSASAMLGSAADGSSWQSLARAGAGRAVILDFAGVAHIDAGGLGILAAFAEAVGARGGCLRLARVRPRVRRMVEVAGLALAVGLPARVAAGVARPQRGPRAGRYTGAHTMALHATPGIAKRFQGQTLSGEPA